MSDMAEKYTNSMATDKLPEYEIYDALHKASIPMCSDCACAYRLGAASRDNALNAKDDEIERLRAVADQRRDELDSMRVEISAAISEIRRLRSERDAAHDALRSVQWGWTKERTHQDGHIYTEHYCPSCGQDRNAQEEHFADCKIASVLGMPTID